MYTNLPSNYIVVTLNNSDTDLSKIFVIMRLFLFQAYQLLAFYELTINA